MLGISSGASLFAVFVLLSQNFFFGPATVPIAAFTGAMAVTLLVTFQGQKGGTFDSQKLLLAGLGISFLLQAILLLMMTLFANDNLRYAALWLSGDLALADWPMVPASLIFICLGMVIIFSRASKINALMLGDDLANGLGHHVHRERLILFLATSLMTAAAVSLSGIVGFIGLMIPHLTRHFCGANHKRLLPMVACAGALFLLFSDLLSRTLFIPNEIPVGVITALIGAPYFLYLLRRKNASNI
jgi:iron complex transport system permease protein